MIHSSPCVVDGVVGVCDVALHLDLDFILCSVEVLENVCPVVQPNAVLCLERRPSISEHVRVHRDRACLWDSYPFLFVQEDLGIVQLVIVSVSNGVVRNNGIHIRSIPYEAYSGRMVMEVMTNSSSSAEWKISYLPSWGTAFQDPLLGTVTVCVEMEEFQNVNLMALHSNQSMGLPSPPTYPLPLVTDQASRNPQLRRQHVIWSPWNVGESNPHQPQRQHHNF